MAAPRLRPPNLRSCIPRTYSVFTGRIDNVRSFGHQSRAAGGRFFSPLAGRRCRMARAHIRCTSEAATTPVPNAQCRGAGIRGHRTLRRKPPMRRTLKPPAANGVPACNSLVGAPPILRAPQSQTSEGDGHGKLPTYSRAHNSPTRCFQSSGALRVPPDVFADRAPSRSVWSRRASSSHSERRWDRSSWTGRYVIILRLSI